MAGYDGNGYTSYSNTNGIKSYVSYYGGYGAEHALREYNNYNTGYNYTSYASESDGTLYQHSYSYNGSYKATNDFKGYAQLGNFGYSYSYSVDKSYGATYQSESYIQPSSNYGGYLEYRSEQFRDAYGDYYSVNAYEGVDANGNVVAQQILSSYYAGYNTPSFSYHAYSGQTYTDYTAYSSSHSGQG